MSVFGARLKNVIEERAVTATSVARAVGVAEKTIYRYISDEKANPRLDIVQRLAEHLETSPAYLLGFEEVA